MLNELPEAAPTSTETPDGFGLIVEGLSSLPAHHRRLWDGR
jgi:hypothetical protein